MEQKNHVSSCSEKNVHRCAVCGHKGSKNENLTMHKLPSNEAIKNLWFEAIGRELKPAARICSNHFKESDYRKGILRRMLNAGAVPSRFNRNTKGSQSDIALKPKNSLGNILNNKQTADPEENLSLETHVDSDSANELCYIYYLDREQNIQFFESSSRHNYAQCVTSNSSESNKLISSMNVDAEHTVQEKSVSDMNIDMIQSISNPHTEEKSLINNNTEPKTLL